MCVCVCVFIEQIYSQLCVAHEQEKEQGQQRQWGKLQPQEQRGVKCVWGCCPWWSGGGGGCKKAFFYTGKVASEGPDRGRHLRGLWHVSTNSPQPRHALLLDGKAYI